MATKTKSINEDYVRMYYEHLYDRIAKQEEYRLSITNYVLSLSALAFTFGYQNSSTLTIINGIGLPLVIIIANMFAIANIDLTKQFILVHQNRAHEILERYAPGLREIDEKYAGERRKGLWTSRSKVQKGIHLLLIFTAIIPIAVYLYQVYA